MLLMENKTSPIINIQLRIIYCHYFFFLFWVAAPMESRYCSSDIVITAFKSFLRLFDGYFHIVWPIQIVYWLWCHSYTLIDNNNNNNLESRKHIITFGGKLDGTFFANGAAVRRVYVVTSFWSNLLILFHSVLIIWCYRKFDND